MYSKSPPKEKNKRFQDGSSMLFSPVMMVMSNRYPPGDGFAANLKPPCRALPAPGCSMRRIICPRDWTSAAELGTDWAGSSRRDSLRSSSGGANNIIEPATTVVYCNMILDR